MDTLQRPIDDTHIFFERLKERFATEEAARASFQQIIWPKGFVCRRCRGTEYRLLKTRDLYVCRKCKTQHSLTAGTVMQGTRIPFSTWAFVLFLVCIDRLDMLQHPESGVSERTRRRWLTKLQGRTLTPGNQLRYAFYTYLMNPNPRPSHLEPRP